MKISAFSRKTTQFCNEIADSVGVDVQLHRTMFGSSRIWMREAETALGADSGWKLDRLTIHWLASSNGNRRLTDM